MTLSTFRRCFAQGLHTRQSRLAARVDSLCVPLEPTWSVNALLSSYQTPSISNAELERLHKLSALVPPKEGSEVHAKLKTEVEELVRLVEAVKLCPLPSQGVPGTISDGRVWAEGTGINLASPPLPVELENTQDPSSLLQHSVSAMHGYYTVDSDKRLN